MSQPSEWTPYPHEALRVRLLWRKRILLLLVLALVFTIWFISLDVSTDTETQVQVHGGDGSTVTVNRPDEEQVQAAASVILRPGETARLDEDLTLNNRRDQQGQGTPPLPPEPEGVPILGILIFLIPFLLALLVWRQMGDQGPSIDVNYGIYKGAMPLELITASHRKLVQTGKVVERNPFGKERSDYLREAYEGTRRAPVTPDPQ